jgi:hypothetical protein
MPDRILKASIITAERFSQLSWPAMVFFYKLLNVVDDFGRFDGRDAILRAAMYPLNLEKVTEPDVRKWKCECIEAGVVRGYAVEGKEYISLTELHWKARAESSKYPPPPADGCAQMRADANKCSQPKANAPVVVVVDVDVDAAAAKSRPKEIESPPPKIPPPAAAAAAEELPGEKDLRSRGCDASTARKIAEERETESLKALVLRFDEIAKTKAIQNPSGLAMELHTKGFASPRSKPPPSSHDDYRRALRGEPRQAPAGAAP